ncbi:MAG TPA: Lrp/AsnC family transcriptional regulator, partial [Symbiobacteriaceae bacterium]|nr:Lrp/AsnC family transcriptional regulator [Symbiobacteriaceae bacterium]
HFHGERVEREMLDQTDLAILRLLSTNARLTWKEVGEQVHLTGQAVAGRITRLQDLGVLKGFTVEVDQERLGRPLLAFVTVFMKSTDHEGFRTFLAGQSEVEEAFRVSGEGCYWLRVRCASQQELTTFLDRTLRFGNYRVNLNLGQVK